MQMTKRDIADIVLVWILFSVILMLLMAIAVEASFINMAVDPTTSIHTAIFLGFEALRVLLLLLLSYALLFKRPAVLSFLFPDAREKEIAVPAGLEVLGSLAFWIRLFGIFKFLSYGVQFIGHFGTSAVMEWQFLDLRSFRTCVPNLVGAVLAAAIVWKADWIAEKLDQWKTVPEGPNADAEDR
jgi:hypothetical protein